jgi:hypothetical protein
VGFLWLFILVLVVVVVWQSRRIAALEERVSKLEQQPGWLLPASYGYLTDLEQWMTKKGR